MASVKTPFAADTFYEQSKHGWFWYQELPRGEEKTIDEEKKQLSPVIQPSLNNYSIDELWNMHPDSFQALLGKLQKKAVQFPIEQNILEYLTMQDIARRKALAYTNATMYVTQKYSDIFNVGQVYPATQPGITARVSMQQEEISSRLNNAKDDHALLFFSSSDCGFCRQQREILEYFTEKYNWQIKVIDISRFPEKASRFNISITPTLLLIKKARDDYLTVSTGVIALSELEKRLYRAIRFLSGNTKADTFLLYDYQKDSTLDPTSILNNGKQPWKSPNKLN